MIIGITGAIGSGKGTIVEFLKKKGFKHYSGRAFVTEEIIRRKLEVTRENMVLVANDLRKKYGPDYFAEQLYERAKKGGGNAVLESLRTPGEIESLREKGDFIMFAVDADQKKRYERNFKRGTETDNISFEKFVEDERREASSDDPNKQNINACIAMADYRFNNDGSVDDLYKQVERVLDGLKK